MKYVFTVILNHSNNEFVELFKSASVIEAVGFFNHEAETIKKGVASGSDIESESLEIYLADGTDDDYPEHIECLEQYEFKADSEES